VAERRRRKEKMTMAEYKDPYKVLGVNPTDSDETIKDAYRKLARKYHPDKYADGDLKELAEEKMKEINSAYEEIQKMRQSGGSSGGGYSSGSGSSGSGNYKYANIRRNINMGNIGAAEAELNAISEGDRAAEWHYLMGCVLIKKGYYVDAQKMINTACNMDPSNSEYRAARDRLNMQARGYGGGYQTSRASGCSGCDVCSSLLCADCCCECMGGDLIRCC
jgi:hypothetical protein